ncbi:DNA damage-inducible v-SNARE binding protein, putative [Babesia ovis]|uniref:DNA damage-inducible v-SNARE binding protein, putative n=1 Tax=Babesia ovis TaxID=5869 RepID=A0A9W5WVP5_BABOV|nr:DNA damage-inducible v-SNARE binding protein, putative [Babesia ovis]
MLSVNVATQDDRFATLYLEEDWTLARVRILIYHQLNIPESYQNLILDGRSLTDDKQTVQQLGLKTGDVIYVMCAPPAAELQPEVDALGMANAIPEFEERLRRRAMEMLETLPPSPLKMEAVKDAFPTIHAALVTGDLENVVDALRSINLAEIQKQRQRQMELLRAYRNPLSPESQRIIQENIDRNRIDENMLSAQEFLPEAYGSIVLLFVPVEVNGVKFHALVDTGAQETVMRTDYAEQCNLMSILDRRYHGVAVGVSKGRILGRVHMAHMRIGKSFIPFSCLLMEQLNVGLIIGLDLLRRYQCVVNLKENTLYIGDEKVPFLSEGELRHGTGIISDVEENGDESNEPNTPTSKSGDSVSGEGSLYKNFAFGESTSSYGGSTSSGRIKREDNEMQPSGESIKRLVELLGVSREKAIDLLRSTNGDIEMAASLYFEEQYD